MILAGDPAAMIAAAVLVAIVVASRAPRPLVGLGRVALAGVAAAAMAGLVLVTATAYLQDSERSAGLGTSGASVWSLHPLRALEWIWPAVFGDEADKRLHLARLVADGGARATLPPQFTPNLHVGLAVLLLAGLAVRRDRRLLALLVAASGVFILLALGEHTPFYAAWRAVVPPERIVRYPERHLAGALVVWSALAGVGFTRVFAGRDRGAGRAALAGALLLAALVAGAALARGPLVQWLGGLRPADHPVVMVPHAVDLALRSGAIAVAFAIGFWVVVRWSARRLAPILVLGPLFAANLAFVPTLDRDAVLAMPDWLRGPLAEDIAAHERGAPVARVFRDKRGAFVSGRLGPLEIAVLAHESVADHQTARYGLAEVPGYHTTGPSREKALWRAADGPALERLCDLLDVGWALLPDGDPRAATMLEVARTPVGYRLLRNPARRPRAFVAPRWSRADDARAALLAAEIDFHEVRLEGTGQRGGREGSLSACVVTTPRPELVVQKCESDGGWAVLLDAWSPGWSATVDGTPAEVVRAEAVARAVAVGAGPHVIEWRYRTPGLRPGAAISAVAWGGWLVVAIRVRARRRRV
jgi:hypothetical protein